MKDLSIVLNVSSIVGVFCGKKWKVWITSLIYGFWAHGNKVANFYIFNEHSERAIKIQFLSSKSCMYLL